MAMASAVKQSLGAFSTRGTHAAADLWAPATYIASKNDNAVPYEAQLAWAKACRANVMEIDAGHSPFLRDDATHVADIIDVVAAQEVVVPRLR
jgi:predicted alpha/beta hydrolase family esterase